MKKKQIKSGTMQNTKIDGDAIKTKVSTLEKALSQNETALREEKRKTLNARAKSLALENQDKSAEQEYIEVIAFSLGSETYAFEIQFVREVYLLDNFTPLPGLPDFVLGIINIRGQILSIVDLKKLFNLPVKGIGELNKIIVIQNGKMEFGILADIILGTHSIPLNSVQTSYTNMPGIDADYLKGVSSEHLIILNAKNMLEDEKIIINQTVE